MNGTRYSWSACLDVENSDRKEPEGLLESETHGETPIVLERKAVVWPADYLSSHSKEHQIFDLVDDELRERFSDGMYQLTVKSRHLKRKSQSDVKGIVKQIAQILKSDSERAKRGGRCVAPIPWTFRALTPYELEDRYPHVETGIVVVIEDPLIAFGDAWDLHTSKSMNGYAERFVHEAEKAAEKFENYSGPGYLRLFLVEFYGDTPFHEDIIQIIKQSPIPGEIDEVWLKSEDWVSDDELIASWDRVR